MRLRGGAVRNRSRAQIRSPVPRLPAFQRHRPCIPGDGAHRRLRGFRRDPVLRAAAASGNTIARGFCPVCGSPLFNTMSGYPNVRGVHVGSLDDPSGFKPQKAVWHAEAQPWDFLDPDVPTS